MSSYITRYCTKHGEWDQDIDDPYEECPECTELGIIDACRKIDGPTYNNPFVFNGMKVFEEPAPPPKIQLSKNVDVSDQFRREINAWLVEMFGYRESILKDQFLVSQQFGMIVAPHGKLSLLTTCC